MHRGEHSNSNLNALCMRAQVPLVVKVPMAPYQSVLYNWVKASGTIRLDPDGPRVSNTARVYATLNNKCMELRKVTTPFLLTTGDTLLTSSGKETTA